MIHILANIEINIEIECYNESLFLTKKSFDRNLYFNNIERGCYKNIKESRMKLSI